MLPQLGALHEVFVSSFAAIDLLYAHELIQPCLTQLYSTVDAAAWLSVEGEKDVTRADFMRWAERYLLPQGAFQFTSIELYAARCSALHSMSALSSLSRAGKARTLTYAWGNETTEALEVYLDALGRNRVVAVHLNDLRTALPKAVQSFLNEASGQPELWTRVEQRSRYYFTSISRIGSYG